MGDEVGKYTHLDREREMGIEGKRMGDSKWILAYTI